LELLTWTLSNSPQGFSSGLQATASPLRLELLDLEEPVVVFDSDLVETNQVADAAQCLRALDDHFPPDVPPAWIRREEALNDRGLRDKVIFEDRDELEPNSDA
jgi:hypothetical protein